MDDRSLEMEGESTRPISEGLELHEALPRDMKAHVTARLTLPALELYHNGAARESLCSTISIDGNEAISLSRQRMDRTEESRKHSTSGPCLGASLFGAPAEKQLQGSSVLRPQKHRHNIKTPCGKPRQL